MKKKIKDLTKMKNESKELKPLEALDELHCVAQDMKPWDKKTNEAENIIEKSLKALEIITNIFKIEIDLRPENEESLIYIGDNVCTISHDKAKLLKESLK